MGRRSFYLAAILYFTVNCVFSQANNTICGHVVDNTDGAALTNCSVFIANTSKGTVSDKTGFFSLPKTPNGTYDLIVSSIGYETLVFNFIGTGTTLNIEFRLSRKAELLNSVLIETNEKNGWAKWGKLFLDNFIGTTLNGRECKLKNYEAIKFHFSRKKNTLTAISNEELLIENKALGYLIKYKLEKFNMDFNTNITTFLGYPLFIETPASKKQRLNVEILRRKAYLGSINHFMKCLFERDLWKEGFQVIKKETIQNVEKERIKKLYEEIFPGADTGLKFPLDSLSYYHNELNKPDSYESYVYVNEDSLVTEKQNQGKFLFFTGRLTVMFRNPIAEQYEKSEIYLATPNPIQIFKNGIYYSPLELISNGYWALHEKMANELPLDFNEKEK